MGEWTGWIQPDFLLVEKEGGVFFHCQMAVLEIRSPMEDGECSKEEKSIRLCKKNPSLHPTSYFCCYFQMCGCVIKFSWTHEAVGPSKWTLSSWMARIEAGGLSHHLLLGPFNWRWLGPGIFNLPSRCYTSELWWAPLLAPLLEILTRNQHIIARGRSRFTQAPRIIFN